MSKNKAYFIYDSRYTDNPDRATVLSVCETLEEAEKESPDYGYGNCIVEVEAENNIITKETFIKSV